MVKGLNKFREYFSEFPEHYIIIGGTACDIIISEAGLISRATKDMDIILIIEALNGSFVEHFWEFIKKGNYERTEKSNNENDRKYYRFIKPLDKTFPFQIELFSRKLDLIDFDNKNYLTPIPVDDDLSSLSAILMNEDYYNYVLKNSNTKNQLNLANTEALICLKAKAYLEIKERIDNGYKVDKRHLKKHKNDIFRLGVLLTKEDIFDLPINIKTDLQDFIYLTSNNLPDNSVFKKMGLGTIKVDKVLSQIKKSFKLINTSDTYT